ncbi:AAA family ATPase [Candidatus Omnitrophota bacterium]
MSKFKFYALEELFAMDIKPRGWLVKKFVHEKDSILLVGGEKAGKTLLAFQMACSMSAGEAFLDSYDVTKECKVTYLQLEGELEDSVDRLRLMRKSCHCNPKNFQLAFLPPINLEDPDITEMIVKDTTKFHHPDVIFIDPVYFSLDGDLSDNTAVRRFIGQIRILKERLNCAIILVHHTHKAKTGQYGQMIDEGDEAAFGSKFFKAYPDHTILFNYDKKRDLRVLTCGTQRSGKIERNLNLKLVEPDPLYYRVTDEIPTKEVVVLNCMPEDGSPCDYAHIHACTKLSRQTIYATIRTLVEDEYVIKDDSKRPVLYTKVVIEKKKSTEEPEVTQIQASDEPIPQHI